MSTWIAFLRGINVGGRNKLTMQELTLLLEGLGCADIRTYVQSGNVIFRHRQSDADRLAREMSAAIQRDHGFAPSIVLRTREQLERAVADNPFPDSVAEPTTLHLFFLAHVPKHPHLAELERTRAQREEFRLVGKTFYLRAPDGFGKSKLAARAETLLVVPATARNWRTVMAVLELARTLG